MIDPNIGFLSTITAEILDETIGEKITVEKSHKRLFITARKPVVPVILARINTILESLDRQQINLDGVPRDLVKREYINELEKVTKSIIIADNPGDVSQISGA